MFLEISQKSILLNFHFKFSLLYFLFYFIVQVESNKMQVQLVPILKLISFWDIIFDFGKYSMTNLYISKSQTEFCQYHYLISFAKYKYINKELNRIIKYFNYLPKNILPKCFSSRFYFALFIIYFLMDFNQYVLIIEFLYFYSLPRNFFSLEFMLALIIN